MIRNKYVILFLSAFALGLLIIFATFGFKEVVVRCYEVQDIMVNPDSSITIRYVSAGDNVINISELFTYKNVYDARFVDDIELGDSMYVVGRKQLSKYLWLEPKYVLTFHVYKGFSLNNNDNETLE